MVPPSPSAGRLVAGIGFRQSTEADEIVALIRRALVLAGLPEARLSGLALPADRAGEASARAVAAAFALPLTEITAEAMRAADGQVATRSARIVAARGVGSVAEAAALALAGESGRLILPRIASANATCALALALQTP